MEYLNSYEQFFQICSKESFFDFGLKNIISIEPERARVLWNNLKSRVGNKSTDLFIRSCGRNGNGNNIVKTLYKSIFELEINVDPSNNTKPTQLLEQNTNYKKNKTIYNYQVSHVFGQTKNVFCFTAPWNIVFIPKIIDPLTGHEAKGDFVEEFQSLFQSYIYEKYKEMIDEYNEIMDLVYPIIKSWLENQTSDVDTYLKDFKKIII